MTHTDLRERLRAVSIDRGTNERTDMQALKTVANMISRDPTNAELLMALVEFLPADSRIVEAEGDRIAIYLERAGYDPATSDGETIIEAVSINLVAGMIVETPAVLDRLMGMVK